MDHKAFNVLGDTMDAWKDVLEDVKAIALSAVIAGGALRDLILGGEVKDLDIFVPVDESKGRGPALIRPGTLDSTGWVETKRLVTMDYQVGMRTEVAAVAEYTHADLSIPVQIIHLTFPGGLGFAKAAISRMDFDACMIAWDGNRYTGLEELLEISRTKTWTLVNCEDDTQAKRSLKRAAKFSGRYPAYQFDLTKAANVPVLDMVA